MVFFMGREKLVVKGLWNKAKMIVKPLKRGGIISYFASAGPVSKA
jgi:hypothetical protein